MAQYNAQYQPQYPQKVPQVHEDHSTYTVPSRQSLIQPIIGGSAPAANHLLTPQPQYVYVQAQPQQVHQYANHNMAQSLMHILPQNQQWVKLKTREVAQNQSITSWSQSSSVKCTRDLVMNLRNGYFPPNAPSRCVRPLWNSISCPVRMRIMMGLNHQFKTNFWHFCLINCHRQQWNYRIKNISMEY